MPDRVSRAITPQFLQRVSLGFTNREMIADRVAPVIPVAKDRGNYRVWGRNQFMQHEARWAYGATPNAIEVRWSQDTYYSEGKKLRTKLLDAEVKNADDDLDLRASYTEFVTDAIIIAREKRVADLFTTAANYPGAHTVTKGGGAEWDTVLPTTPKQPITDMEAGIRLVSAATMQSRSNITIVMPEPVFDLTISQNSFLLGTLNYTSPESYPADLLARFLRVKEVLIAAVMTTGPGPESATADVVTGFVPTYLWGDNVWIGVVNRETTQRQPTFARSFNWRVDTAGQQRQIRQYRHEDEGTECDWIECKENMGEKIVFSSAGYLIKNTLAAI
jgi:hypothetical protein